VLAALEETEGHTVILLIRNEDAQVRTVELATVHTVPSAPAMFPRVTLVGDEIAELATKRRRNGTLSVVIIGGGSREITPDLVLRPDLRPPPAALRLPRTLGTAREPGNPDCLASTGRGDVSLPPRGLMIVNLFSAIVMKYKRDTVDKQMGIHGSARAEVPGMQKVDVS